MPQVIDFIEHNHLTQNAEFQAELFYGLCVDVVTTAHCAACYGLTDVN